MVEHSLAPLDRVFSAVADPTRRAILEKLGRGPARVTEIARQFPVSLNAVSKHVMVLERAGLLRRDIQGRDHVLSLEPHLFPVSLNAVSKHVMVLERAGLLRRDIQGRDHVLSLEPHLFPVSLNAVSKHVM